jgi:DNA repair photolyase
MERTQIGKTEITYKHAAGILTEAKGFMASYDYTLNPYSGCAFGCTYCYAAFFSRSLALRQNWGYWLHVKENALQLLEKFRKKSLHDKRIYMSSVTDPYQLIEKELGLTRSLLQELLVYHQPRLVIQTRSPLATRDIDLFQQFHHIQVNMTITTDNEVVRKVFEPLCPSNAVRLEAIKQVNDAGVPACITLTPLLPIEDAERFAKMLLNTGVNKFIIQPFHSEKGRFVGATREDASRLIKEMNWTMDKYQMVYDVLQKYIPDIGVGKDGFNPI